MPYLRPTPPRRRVQLGIVVVAFSTVATAYAQRPAAELANLARLKDYTKSSGVEP